MIFIDVNAVCNFEEYEVEIEIQIFHTKSLKKK